MSSETLRDLTVHAIGGGWGQDVPDERHSEAVAVIRGTDIPRIAAGDLSSVPRRFETASKVKSRLLQPGDIVIEVSGGSAASGQHTGRAIAVSARTIEKLGGRVIPASFCRLLRLDCDQIDPTFICYQIQGLHLSGEIAAFENQSTGIANFQFTRFVETVRPGLVDIAEQRIASSVLQLLDNRITLLRETNATLEAIAQALFKSWFVDFDPVRAKMEGRTPEGMDEAAAALFPDEFETSELGEVPRGWMYCSLKEVCSIFDSKRVPLSGLERAKRRGPYPYYGAAALMDYVDGYMFDGVYLLTGEDGSVADAQGFPITQYVWGKFWVNNHAHVLQGERGFSTEHLALALRRVNIQPYITGAVQAKLSKSNMWRINVLNPGQDMANAFGMVITPLYEAVRANVEQAQTLSTLRDTLLPRLVSGQLRLPDAPVADEIAPGSPLQA